MQIKVLHLYYDLLNLYGEYGNVNILVSHLEDQGCDVILDKKTMGDSFDLNYYDFIYCGSGIESHIKMALEDLKNHKDELIQYINNNKVALFTGSSLEMLGKSIAESDSKVDGLGVFDYEVQRLKDRKTDDVIFSSEVFEKEVVGFINKQANIINNENHLFTIKFGIGENEDKKYEGAYKNNLFATYVIGPLLVRNPHVLKIFVEKIIHSVDANYEIKTIDYKNEEDGYNLVLNELSARITHK